MLGFSFFNSQPQNDSDVGRIVLTYFNNGMVSKYGPDYNLTVNEMLNRVSASPDGVPHPDILTESVGLAVNAVQMSVTQWQDAMDTLVAQSNGALPANQTVFFKALSDRASELTAGDWISATPQIALQSAGQVVAGAQAVGTSLIKTGSILTGIFPIVAVSAILFIITARTKQWAGR